MSSVSKNHNGNFSLYKEAEKIFKKFKKDIDQTRKLYDVCYHGSVIGSIGSADSKPGDIKLISENITRIENGISYINDVIKRLNEESMQKRSRSGLPAEIVNSKAIQEFIGVIRISIEKYKTLLQFIHYCCLEILKHYSVSPRDFDSPVIFMKTKYNKEFFDEVSSVEAIYYTLMDDKLKTELLLNIIKRI